MCKADILAKQLLFIAVALILLMMLTGCSMGTVDAEKSKNDSTARVGSAVDKVIVNINQLGRTGNTPGIVQKIPESHYVPAPELENVNRYANALEGKLLRRYNNTPGFQNNIAKVQLLPVGKPKTSMDGKKLRMEWSQVVFNIWGERVAELEKEFYVVTFGDGKPLMQRTRPSITVGMNNEGGYSEFDRVRGGRLSKMNYKGSPEMFDIPDGDKDTMLYDNIKSKNSAPAPYHEYDLPEIDKTPLRDNSNPKQKNVLPIIKPAPENLQAVVVPRRSY